MTKSNTYSPNWKRWHKAGFTSELLPIIPPGATLAVNTKIKAENVGKVPGVKNDDTTWNGYREWTDVHANKAHLKMWESWGAGIGMQGRQFPAVDIDVNDEQIAQTILMLALDAFGAAPIRYRDGSPRLLLMYSAKEGIPKRRIAFRMNDKDHVVEFLGRGQYYNVEGLHPKAQVYCWQESDGCVHPCDLKPSGLTEIREEKVTRFFDQVEEFVQLMGGEIVDRSKGSNGERDPDAGKRVADEDDWVLDRCERWLPYAPEAAQGLRDNTAVAVSNRFYDWGAEQARVEELLLRWNEEKCYPPLDNDDIKRIADSAMKTRHRAIGCDHWTTWSKGFEVYEMSPEQQAKHDKRQAEIDAMEDDANEEAERKARNVKTLSASTLMNMHFNPVNYIVPDVLVEGLTIFAGKPKIGKSWLLLHAANAIAEGGTTLGGLKCAEGDVLYCALEDNPRRLQSRMKALFGKSRKWSERLDFVTEMPRLAEGGLKVISDWIEAAECPRLVIIDTLAMVRMPNRKDQSSYDADYGAVVDLRTLAQKHGIAIVLVHHLRKADSDDPFDTVSGTLGLTGAADAMLVLRRDTTGGIVLHGRGRDLAELEKAMEFDRGTCTWRLRGDASVARRSSERNAILVALREIGQGAGPNEIAEVAGLRATNVRQSLRRMAKEGLVSRLERGKYEAASGVAVE